MFFQTSRVQGNSCRTQPGCLQFAESSDRSSPVTADLYNTASEEEDDSVESRNAAGYTFKDQEIEDEPTVIGAFQPMLFSTSTRRVRDLNSDFTNQELDPRPSFQRGYVWDLAKASRLIESVLLNVPLPLIYTAEEADSNKEVVIDGQQRLLTLFGYVKGEFPRNGRPFRLKHLKILSDLNGKLFGELEDPYRTKIIIYDMTIRSKQDCCATVFCRLPIILHHSQ